MHRCPAVCGKVRVCCSEPDGLRRSQRAVLKGAGMQHQVSDYEAVHNGEGGQHQRRGQGRVSQRPGRTQAEPAVQLQVQKRHEEGEELSTHLLGTLPTFKRCAHQ